MKTFMQYLVENNNVVDKIIQKVASEGLTLLPIDESTAEEIVNSLVSFYGIKLIDLKKVNQFIYSYTYKLNTDTQTNEDKIIQSYLIYYSHEFQGSEHRNYAVFDPIDNFLSIL